MKIRIVKIIAIIGFFIGVLSFPTSSSEITKSLLFPEYSRRISMDFKDANLKDVLKIFSQQSGLNFIASQDVQDKKVTMYLDDVPVEVALEQLLTANRLKYEIEQGGDIFIVRPLLVPKVETITKVYFLKYASVSGAKISSEISGGLGEADEGGEDGEGGKGIASIISNLLSGFGNISENVRTNSLTITDIPDRFPLIEQTIAKLDVSLPQVLIEIEMLDVSKNALDELGVQWPEAIASLNATGLSRSTAFPFRGSGKGADITGSHFGASTLTVIGATLALDFLTTQSDTKYLARPRILTLSNETAEIKISAQEAIGESSVTSSSEGTATTTQEAERYETGVIMRVTPQVNLDTGEITMYIDPKVVDVKQGGTFGGVTYNDPETRGTKSVVRVQDGETIVLGGLLRKRTNQTLIKVPFLGDIPLIGALFRHKSKTRDEDRELIVFITPRLIQESLPMRTLVAVKELEREQEIPPLPSRTIVINQALADIERKKR